MELRHWIRRVKATVVQTGQAPNTTDDVSRWESILRAARAARAGLQCANPFQSASCRSDQSFELVCVQLVER